MAINKSKKFKVLNPRQIGELTAIYDDFLYIVRGHQGVFHTNSAFDLANRQMASMNMNRWFFESMEDKESKDFHKFIKYNDIKDATKSYIILKHVKSENDRFFQKRFVVPPYEMSTMNMQMPSALERCSIMYPKDGKLGNTVFYVDGLYKLTVNDDSLKDMPISDLFLNPDVFNELYLMINEAEQLFSSNDVSPDAVFDIYADELVAVNENIILELIGVFAERLIAICRDIYGVSENADATTLAEQEGMIQSADAFKEYMNIRNFMRHQWDTLDEFGYFSAEKASFIKNRRAERVESYLKLCDQSRIERMKSYIAILHQVQYVINQINPDRIIRYDTETNSEFIDRLAAANEINPKFQVELNLVQDSKRYEALDRRIHKLFPKMRVVDYFGNRPEYQSKIDEYKIRSYYLQTFQSVECMIMRHCQMRGYDMENRDAWKYANEIGLLTGQELARWQDYSGLRNYLSHYHFGKNARLRLQQCIAQYEKDVRALANHMIEFGPDVRCVKRDNYEYTHDDGLNVVLDYDKHTVESRRFLNPPIHERYIGGVEYNMSNREIIDVKLPNGIMVDLNTGTIYFDDKTAWNFHTLQTTTSKITTGKRLNLVEYTENDAPVQYHRNESMMVDHRYNLKIDSLYRIQEFKYKNANGKFIRAKFVYDDTGCMVVFPDKTIVYQSGPRIKIYHGDPAQFGGTTLTRDNRREFARTYATMHKNIITPNKVRD